MNNVNTEMLLMSRKEMCANRVGCSFFSVHTNPVFIEKEEVINEEEEVINEEEEEEVEQPHSQPETNMDVETVHKSASQASASSFTAVEAATVDVQPVDNPSIDCASEKQTGIRFV